jgi:peptide/nickel transport system permease protein
MATIFVHSTGATGMLKVLPRFVAQIVAVLLLMSFAIYALIGFMPGDPVSMMIENNPGITPEAIQNLRDIYGVDQPLLTGYWHWLAAVLQGDLGFSRLHAQPVVDVLIPAIASTARLMLASFVLSATIAFGLGTAASLRPGGCLDRLIEWTTFAALSLPTFWLALLLILLFSVKLHWLPASGMGEERGSLADTLRHLVLPAATLTLTTTGHFIRYVRAAMIETWPMDHIRTARSKGAGDTRIIFSHALPHALIPIVTVMALSLGTLFSGALVTETIYAQPGMGKMIYDAIQGNDYNLALTGLLVATLITLLSNFTADLVYHVLDPRIGAQ